MKRVKRFPVLILASLLIAVFFVLVGRDSWNWQLLLNGMFYFDIGCVTLIVFILLRYLVWQDELIEKRVSWLDDFWKRLINQLFFGVMIPVLLSIVLVYFYMEFILGIEIFESSYFIYELPISAVFFVLLNLVLGVLYLVDVRAKVPEPSNLQESIPDHLLKPVLAQRGKNKVLIEQSKIQLVEKTGVANIIFCNPSGQFLYQGSLEDLDALLNPNYFFRANRQAIVNRENCKSYLTERSGKVILSLKCPELKQLTISQKKSKDFKNWLIRKY